MVKVAKREENTENKDLSTGKIEIKINEIKILSEAKELLCRFLVNKITQKK